MKLNRPGYSLISCVFCEWKIDVSPWISGRTITWPWPFAHLLFLAHRRREHSAEYPAWRAKYMREREGR